MDLTDIYFVSYLSSCLATEAALLCFRIEELFAVRGSISNVEYVSEHWSTWKLDPV